MISYLSVLNASSYEYSHKILSQMKKKPMERDIKHKTRYDKKGKINPN
jgi:hypothetical protein